MLIYSNQIKLYAVFITVHSIILCWTFTQKCFFFLLYTFPMQNKQFSRRWRDFVEKGEVREAFGRTVVHFNDCDYFAHVAFQIKLFESFYISENKLLNL